MEALPFIQVENLAIVPVLRSRLAFAALFRRALGRLDAQREWDGKQDLICLSLPQSLESPIRAAIAELPKLSQVWSSSDEFATREIFAVTPCDAFVEAARTGADRRIPVQFMDAEITPGNIPTARCM